MTLSLDIVFWSHEPEFVRVFPDPCKRDISVAAFAYTNRFWVIQMM